MRIVFARPFSLTPASRMLESPYDEAGELLADLGGRARHAEVARLRHREAGIAARIDGRGRCEVHVDVEREAMVRAAARHPYAEGRHCGTVHIDSRRAGPPFSARADEIDHRLLEQADERFHLEGAAAEIDQRIEHDLSGAMVGDL